MRDKVYVDEDACPVLSAQFLFTISYALHITVYSQSREIFNHVEHPVFMGCCQRATLQRMQSIPVSGA
jgi:uncharacterized protein YaiI (UPF0178 family)